MSTSGKPQGKMSHLEKYVEYVKNATGANIPEGLPIAHFDEDWEPIGNVVRFDLRKDGLIVERDGRLFLTNKALQNR